MTVRGGHLICDCSKAIKSAKCPRPIFSPTKEKDNSYYHCTVCKLDFSCSQAIKNVTEKDKYGFPQTEKKVCRKCESKLEKRVWPPV